MLFNDFLHLIHGILGTGEKILRGINHIRQALGIFFHRGNIHHTGNVHAAITYKDADTGFLIGNIDFLGHFHTAGEGVTGLGQAGSGGTGGRTGFDNRAGNIFGFLKNTAGVNTGAGSLNGCKRMGHRKVGFIHLNPQPFSQLDRGLGHLKTH